MRDLAEPSLFLLRAIYDAYETTGDSVIRTFRFADTDLHHRLQPKLVQIESMPEEFLGEHNSDSGELSGNN